jgi:hypothetical protein
MVWEGYNLQHVHIQTNKQTNKTRGVSHFGLAIYIKKSILKAKEELQKLKYFTMQ